MQGAASSQPLGGSGLARGKRALLRNLWLPNPWFLNPVALKRVVLQRDLRKGSRRVDKSPQQVRAGPQPAARPAPPPFLRPAPVPPPRQKFRAKFPGTQNGARKQVERPDVMRGAANPLRLRVQEAGLEDAERSNRWSRGPGEPMRVQQPLRPNAASGFPRETRRLSVVVLVSSGPLEFR